MASVGGAGEDSPVPLRIDSTEGRHKFTTGEATPSTCASLGILTLGPDSPGSTESRPLLSPQRKLIYRELQENLLEDRRNLPEDRRNEILELCQNNSEYLDKFSVVFQAQNGEVQGDLACLNAVKLPNHILVLKDGKISVIDRTLSASLLGAGAMKVVTQGSQSSWVNGAVQRAKVAIGEFNDSLSSIRSRLIASGDKISRATHDCPGCVDTDFLFYEDSAGEVGILTVQEKIPDYLTLEDYVKDRELSDSDKIDLVCTLIDDCETMWDAGVVHNDIKDANIIVVFDKNGVASLKLTDFDLGSTGQLAGGGSVHVQSPESIMAKPTEARSDLFCLAQVLHILLFKKASMQINQGGFPGLMQRFAMAKVDTEARENLGEKYHKTRETIAGETPGIQEDFQSLMADATDPNPGNRISLREFSKKFKEMLPSLRGWHAATGAKGSTLDRVGKKMSKYLSLEKKTKVLTTMGTNPSIAKKVHFMAEGKRTHIGLEMNSVELPNGDLLYMNDRKEIDLLETSKSQKILGEGGMKIVQRSWRPGEQVTLGSWKADEGELLKSLNNMQAYLSEVNQVKGVIPTKLFFYVDTEGAVQCKMMQQFVSDYTDLKDYLGRGAPRPLSEKLNILSQMGNSLEEVHAKGVGLNDVKPANIVMQDEKPHLTDYVDSIRTFDPETGIATSESHACSTPYAPPERFLPNEPGHPAKMDVFSFAVMTHEILLGGRPQAFSNQTGENMQEFLQRRATQAKELKANQERINELLPREQMSIPGASVEVSNKFHSLMIRAMAPDPEVRCSMREFNAAFSEIKQQIERDPS